MGSCGTTARPVERCAWHACECWCGGARGEVGARAIFIPTGLQISGFTAAEQRSKTVSNRRERVKTGPACGPGTTFHVKTVELSSEKSENTNEFR